MGIGWSANQMPLDGRLRYSTQQVYKDDVGLSLQLLATVVPDGMLVFMPSHRMVKDLTSHWKETGVMLSSTSACSGLERDTVYHERQVNQAEQVPPVIWASCMGRACVSDVLKGVYNMLVSD